MLNFVLANILINFLFVCNLLNVLNYFLKEICKRSVEGGSEGEGAFNSHYFT